MKYAELQSLTWTIRIYRANKTERSRVVNLESITAVLLYIEKPCTGMQIYLRTPVAIGYVITRIIPNDCGYAGQYIEQISVDDKINNLIC